MSVTLNDRLSLFGPVVAGTRDLPIEWPINDPAIDIEVTRQRAGVVVALIAASDWTFTAATVGGTVTLSVPATANDRYIVRGLYPVARASQLSASDSFSAASLNREFDRLWMTAQEAARESSRSVKVPYGEAGIDLPTIAERAGNLLGFDVNGLASAIPASSLPGGGGPITANQIIDSTADGRALLTQTLAQQRATLLIPDGKAPEDYGAVGDGVADDTAAIAAALAANNGSIIGRAGAIYRMEGQFVPPADFSFDLNGATLKPIYSGFDFAIRRSVAHGTSNSVASNVAGSRTITLAAAPVDIAAGDVVFFTTTSSSGRMPATMRQVTSTGATTITVDAALPAALPAGTTVARLNAAGRFRLVNGTINCIGLTDPGGGEALGFASLAGYEDVEIAGLEIENFVLNPASTDYLFWVAQARSVRVRDVRCENLSGERGILTAYQCESGITENVAWSGDGFGVAPFNCDKWVDIGTKAHGRWINGGSSKSIRAIRPIGCRDVTIENATIIAYDSAFKNEDNYAVTVRKLTTHNCNNSINVSHQNSSTLLGHMLVDELWSYDSVGDAIYDVDTVVSHHTYKNIHIERPNQHGINFAGERRHFDRITVLDWLSGFKPIVGSKLNGVEVTGTMRDVWAYTTNTAGRYGIDIPSTSTGFLIDDFTVRCNIVSNNRPRVAREVMPTALVELYRLNGANFNTTADQLMTNLMPAGYTRFRLQAIVAYWVSGASLTTAAGGIYTGAGKTGTAVVANTQTFASMTGNGTNKAMTVTVAGAENIGTNNQPFYFSLTTAQGAAATGDVVVYGFVD